MKDGGECQWMNYQQKSLHGVRPHGKPAKYRQLVDSFNAEAAPNGGKLIVGGRLGEYRYYDMDKSVAAAISVLQ